VTSVPSASDAERYWEARARAFAWDDDDGWAAVCHRGAPFAYNRFIDWAQRRAFQTMLLRADIRPPGRAIDIGCGTGRWTRLLHAAGFDAQGFDVAPAMVARASELAPAVPFGVASATALPVEDEGVDLVTCITVLHHIPLREQEDAVAEIARILRPGGKCLVLMLVKTLPSGGWCFPRSRTGWVQLFGRQSMSPVYASGEEYLSPAVLLHWFASGLRATAHGRSAASDRAVGSGSGLGNSVYRAFLKLAATMSYPWESWASRRWPGFPASAVALVFKKSI
jgi:SAM-dependent methyltransferase